MKKLLILCCVVGCEGKIEYNKKSPPIVSIGQLPTEDDHIHTFGRCHHAVFIRTKDILYNTYYDLIETSCQGKYIHIKYKKYHKIYSSTRERINRIRIATYLMKDVEICPYD